MSVLSKYLEKLENWDTKTFLNLYKSDFSTRIKQFAKIYSFFGSLYSFITFHSFMYNIR